MYHRVLGLGCALAVTTALQAADLAPLGIRQDVDAWHVGSIAAGRGPAAAYWNPALLGYQGETAQLELIFSGEGDDHPQRDEYGIFTQLGGLGVGVIHEESAAGYANHYRLGLGFGERGAYSGISYGWSVGNWDSTKTPDQIVISSLNHPHRFVGIGTSLTYALGQNYDLPRGTIEAGLALRPFTERVTLSVDGAWRFDKDAYVERSAEYWAGVEVEPVDFVRVSARKHLDTDDMSIQASLNLRHMSLGGIFPSAEDDNADPGMRTSILLSDRSFHKGLPMGHKKHLFARVELSGMAGEYPWLMVGQKFRLHRFFKQMDEAQKNPRVKGLFLDIKPDFQADLALLREVRTRIQEYKQATGGEVALYAHGFDLPTLYLASVADRRAMLPIGGAQLDNLGRERIYWAEAFEEAGIDFVRYNVGAYKGAGEDFDKSGMSPEVRENVGRCLNDIYAHVTSEIRQGYNMSESQAQDLFAKWFLTVDELKAFHLVDTLLYDDQVEDWVCRREPSDEDDDSQGGVQIQIKLGFDLDELKKLGQDRVVSLASLTDRPIKRRWAQQPEVAVIYASGPIYSGRSIGPLAIGDQTLVEQFKRVREDDNVKAVVFHIDSPGGSGYASDLVWREMSRLRDKKPLIVVQGFVAASGGYYLSMAADTILSSPTTITGSIGVAAGIFFDKGLMDNSKLRQDGVWAGKKESFGGAMVAAPLDFKAGSAQLRMPTLPVMGRELSEGQGLELQAMIRHFYKDFVQKVADDRDKSWDDIHAIAEGRIWSGPEAEKLGLVDGQGGLREAIELARVKADLRKEDMKVSEIHPSLSIEDLIALLQMLGQGGGMTAAQQRLLEQKTGLTEDIRLSLMGSGKPEMLFDERPYQFGDR
jgi:protease-4